MCVPNFKHIVDSSNDEEALLMFKYEKLLMFYYDLIKNNICLCLSNNSFSFLVSRCIHKFV